MRCQRCLFHLILFLIWGHNWHNWFSSSRCLKSITRDTHSKIWWSCMLKSTSQTSTFPRLQLILAACSTTLRPAKRSASLTARQCRSATGGHSWSMRNSSMFVLKNVLLFFFFNGSYFEQYPSQKYMSNVRKLQFVSAMSIIWLFPQQAAEWGGKANQSSDQDRLWEEFLRQPPSWCRWRWTERRVERCGGRQPLSLK